MLRSFLALFLLPLLALPLSARLIVVDPQGGPGEALLVAAMVSAHDGDVVLLKAGDYSSGLAEPIQFETSASFTLVAEAGCDITLRGLVLLHLGLTAVPTPTIVLRGVDIHGMLQVVGNWNPDGVGGYWVEDADVGPAEQPAATIFGANALFTHCSIKGGDGKIGAVDIYLGDGWPAMKVTQSAHVTIADCIVAGGNANVESPNHTGGDALWLELLNNQKTQTLWISGSQIIGGNDSPLGSHSTPGSGLLVSPHYGSAHVYLRDSTVKAGQVLGEGTPAPDMIAPPGWVQTLPAAARSCSVPSPVRSGETAVFDVKGQFQDVVLLIGSPANMFFKFKPVLQGAIAFSAGDAAPAPLLLITDPSGELKVPFHLPPLPEIYDGAFTLLLQGVFANTDGLTLGAPTSLVWLEQGA